MTHKHSVYDTDYHFVINPKTRVISNDYGKTKLIQYDHNSERLTFEMPRHIDGHDMMRCNAVKIEFINIDTANKSNTKVGSYPVDDVQISPNAEDEDTIIFSWLISQNATQLAGSLNFLIRFLCIADDGETIEYAWHTDIFTGISVSSGMNNAEMILEQYSDVLEQWRIGYFGDIDNCLDEIIATQEIYIMEQELAKAHEELSVAQSELTETQEALTEAETEIEDAEVQADSVLETQNTYIGGEE